MSIEPKDTQSASSKTRTRSQESLYTHEIVLELKQRAELGQQLDRLKDERSVMYDSLQKNMLIPNTAGSSNAGAISELQDIVRRVAAYGPYLQQLREQNLSGELSIKEVEAELRIAHNCLAWIRGTELPRLCGHNVDGYGSHLEAGSK